MVPGIVLDTEDLHLILEQMNEIKPLFSHGAYIYWRRKTNKEVSKKHMAYIFR